MIGVNKMNLQIIELIAEGFTNSEIGEKLYRSPRSIDKRITQLNELFEVKNRTALAVKAIANGTILNPFAPVKN